MFCMMLKFKDDNTVIPSNVSKEEIEKAVETGETKTMKERGSTSTMIIGAMRVTRMNHGRG